MINKHQIFWNLSQNDCKSKRDQKDALLKAAALGHYRALCSLDKREFALAKAIIRQRQSINYSRIYVQKNKGPKQIDAFEKQVCGMEAELIAFVDANQRLPDKTELKGIFFYQTRHMPWYRAIMPFLKRHVFFLHKILFGYDSVFFSLSALKRKSFVDDLAAAEKGILPCNSGQTPKFSAKQVAQSLYSPVANHEYQKDGSLDFCEHIFDINKVGSLEAMQVKKHCAKNRRGPKNIVLYFGGKQDHYVYTTRFMLNSVWSLPDCDEYWHIHLSDRAISASRGHKDNAVFKVEVENMLNAIRSQYKEEVNITVASMCLGSPVAADLCKKNGLKFFSDRSFLSVNEVLNSFYKSVLDQFSVLGKVIYMLLMPIRFIRQKILIWQGYSLDQGGIIRTINPVLRSVHVVQPPKSDKGAKQDQMHKGKGASLLLGLDQEDKQFDDAFLRIVKAFTKHEDSMQAASQVKAPKKSGLSWFASSPKAGKRNHLEAVLEDKTVDQDIKDLLKHMLNWHKDRKSYIPFASSDAIDSRGRKKDPHLQWPSGLTGRGTGENPFWRLNTLVACTESELQGNPMSGPLQADVACCLEHTKPLIVRLCKQEKYKRALRELNTCMLENTAKSSEENKTLNGLSESDI